MMKKPSKVGIVLASLPVVMMLLLCLWIIWKINDGKEAPEGEGLMEMILTFYAMFANLVVYGIYLLVRWFRLPKTDVFYPWVRKIAVGSWGSAVAIVVLYKMIFTAPYNSILGSLASDYVILIVLPILLQLGYFVSELLFYLRRKKQWKENTPAID